MQDTMLMEWQFGAPHLKHYCMPKELVDLSLSLQGLTSNSAMRHIHLQPDASLAWNSRHGHPLGHLILIGAQLKNGLNTWSSVVEVTDPNALPPLNAPYKVNTYPPCIAYVSILDESSVCIKGTFIRNKKDSINARYTGISFSMCQHPEENGVGTESTWRSSEGGPASIDTSWCAQCLCSPREGSGPK
jgi:hypothetical protein